MRFTVALAALLFLSACTDSAPVSVNSPEFTTVPPENPSPPPPPNPKPAATAPCTKSTPPGTYPDRPAQCVEISGTTSVNVGAGQTLTCSGWGPSPGLNDWYPVSADRPRTWLTGNQSIVSISQTSSATATITGVSPGTTWVSCQIDQAIGSVDITVNGTRTLQSMFILPDAWTLQVGQTKNVAVHYVDNYGQVDKMHVPIDQWITDNSAVATVAPTGEFGGQIATVTANGSASNFQDGIAHIRAKAGNITSSPSTFTVNPPPRVTSVSVSPTSATISEFTYATLTATALDQFGRVMSGRSAIWSTDNQNVLNLSSAGPMSVYAQGVHWGSANVFVQVDGVPGNTVPITVTTDGQISGFYVSALSPWGDPFTAPGTYYLTPTVTNPNYPPLSYKWEITYSDGRPGITTGYQSGPYGLTVASGAYKIYVTVTPKEMYGVGYPTRWIYNVCTASGGGGGGQPLASPRGQKNTGTDGTVIQRAVYGCGGGPN